MKLYFLNVALNQSIVAQFDPTIAQMLINAVVTIVVTYITKKAPVIHLKKKTDESKKRV